jgi:uncharacterized protein (DUF1501 family)
MFPMSISRRAFITGAGATAVAGAVALRGRTVLDDLTSSPHTGTVRASTASGSASGKGILVLVALYGGNDGLNTVVPYTDSAYAAARPTLGVQAADVLPLGDGLGLHPNLKGMKALWDQGRLAVVRGVGHAEPTFSHFREMAIWQTAAPTTEEVTGWIGRYLDKAAPGPLFAMSLGPTLPPLLQGASSAGSSIPLGAITVPKGLAAPFTAVSTPYAGEPALAARIAQSGTDLLTVTKSVTEVLDAVPAAGEGGATTTTVESGAGGAGGRSGAGGRGGASSGGLGDQLDTVARLIKGGLPSRVYVVSTGGFDTHGSEKATHDGLMSALDGAVSSFVASVADHPVVLMTFSEFGRRVVENASGGTDHGTSAPLFVAGTGVKGGFYGEQPSLTALDDGNLQYNVDFRSVYATVAGQVLGLDPSDLLLGQKLPTLGFV